MSGDLALFDYQKTGAAFLAQRRHAALFDEMGVGKTAQAVHGANLAKIGTALVVVPHIGLVNWQREIAMWGWHPKSAILSNRQTDSPAPWHVVNYDLLQTDSAALGALQQRRYDLLVIDECQALKNLTAYRTVNIYGRKGIARCADRVWLISGSPCPNHVGELYPALLSCFPETLRSDLVTGRRDGLLTHEMFLRQYCRIETDARGELKVLGTKAGAVGELKTKLAPYMMRRTLKEVLPELPPLRLSTVYLDPQDAMLLMENNAEQQELMTVLAAAIANSSLDDPDDALIAALEETESKPLSTMRRLFGEAKVPLIADMVNHELHGGIDKLVIFYHHQSVGAELCRRLDRFGAQRIDGAIAKRWRQPVIDQFQNDSERRVLLVSLDCGSTVITLTAAAHVLFAECSWTPLTNIQAARRCARLGQHRPVLARFATLAGSLDEIIVAVQARKARGLAHLFATSDYMENENAFERA